MLALVRKRHDGDGWIVFSELSNRASGPGDRYADAFALGVWASTKYEAHLYEFKASREDLKKELRDPKKAEGIGKYATYWWLVLENEKIMTDLLIPECWGILVPKVRGGSKILTVVRKAPKLKSTPFTPQFAIACVRNIAKRYVSNADHERLRTQLDDVRAGRDLAPMPDIVAKDEEIGRLTEELKNLRDGLERFRQESGVDLSEYAKTSVGSWQFGNIGKQVKLAADLHQRIVTGDIHEEVSLLSVTAHRMTAHALELAAGAVALRRLAGIAECKPNCRSMSNWSLGADCSCGAKPLSEVERKLSADVGVTGDQEEAADRDDDPGSGVDRGHVGAPIEDAGLELRDQRAEVPHGEQAS